MLRRLASHPESPHRRDTHSMTGTVVSLSVTCVWLMLALAGASLSASAAERLPAKGRATTDAPEKELFDAMAGGQIEVEFIPRSSQSANVLIRNKSGKPLTIKLPEAFAGVPVLAQVGGAFEGGFGGGGLGGGGLGGGGFGGGVGGGQGLGGGFGGGAGGFGGGIGGFGGGGFGGVGGGFFNLGPDKVGKLQVPCVCLEHGKDDPTPRMKYKLVPLETVTKDPAVAALCTMLGRGEIPQNAAQAAAWHLASDVGWAELAAKNRIETRFQTAKYFTPQELHFAARIVGEAKRRSLESRTLAQNSLGKEASMDQGP